MSQATPDAFAFEPLLSADEAAELLGMHVNTVRLWARDGKIPCFRLGRRLVFRTSALNRLFEVPYTGNAVRAAQSERTAA
jgi:excisionase family DNA binding protein